MATLGTLVTVITADTSGFKTGLASASDQAKQFGQKAGDSMKEATETTSKWGKELEHLGGKFTSLHGILAAGFGLHLGRALFSEIHQLIGEIVEKAAEWLTGSAEIAERYKDAATAAERIAAAQERAVGRGRGQFNLYQGLAHALGEEIPGTSKLPAGITDPGLRSEFDTLQGAVVGAQDRGAVETARLAALRAKREAASANYDPKISDKEWADRIRKIEEEILTAQEKIKEAKEEEVFAQNLLTGLTKAAAERQKQLDEAERINGLRDLMSKPDEKFLKAMQEHDKLENLVRPGHAGFGGLEDLHNQLQMAALGANAPLEKINKEQIKQTGNLDSIDKQMKKFNGAPLVWSGVA